MKGYLVASMSALVLAAGIASADTEMHPKALKGGIASPDTEMHPKALKKAMPDCPAGFMKTDVALSDFTCTTRQIVCPAIPGLNAMVADYGTEARLVGTGVQFSFRCTYRGSGK